MNAPLRIGVAGLGTVGASLLRLIERHGNDLAVRCGRAVSVAGVSARDRRKNRGIDLSGARWFDDPVELARDPGTDLLVELIGGASDYEEYYCPTIEWEWGDGTRSESSSDCDPYVVGTSTIRRRFTVEHVFEFEGAFKVFVRLKKRNREVGAASTTVNVQPGGFP